MPVSSVPPGAVMAPCPFTVKEANAVISGIVSVIICKLTAREFVGSVRVTLSPIRKSGVDSLSNPRNNEGDDVVPLEILIPPWLVNWMLLSLKLVPFDPTPKESKFVKPVVVSDKLTN